MLLLLVQLMAGPLAAAAAGCAAAAVAAAAAGAECCCYPSPTIAARVSAVAAVAAGLIGCRPDAAASTRQQHIQEVMERVFEHDFGIQDKGKHRAG